MALNAEQFSLLCSLTFELPREDLHAEYAEFDMYRSIQGSDNCL